MRSIPKAHRLHDPEDRRYVLCDDVLQEVFGCSRFAAADLVRLVNENVTPADPIVIDYTIKREGNWQDYRECYDLEVEVDETIPHKHPLLSGNPASLREVFPSILRNSFFFSLLLTLGLRYTCPHAVVVNGRSDRQASGGDQRPRQATRLLHRVLH